MKVVNINNTSDNTCSCGSWLEHWKDFSNQSLPSCCPEKSCPNKPDVGAHVQKDSVNDNNWYIVPLCKDCNAKAGGSLEIGDDIALVAASVNETCG
ncbi:hypothetical protein ACFLZC_00535 [Patescibacteria group bacterium]